MISPRIRLEEILGRGASGTVWLASNVETGGALAVKLLDSTDASAVATVRREASIIGRIHSPHIVQLFDVGCTEYGSAFIVMERLRGEDLASLLRRISRLDAGRTAVIISQAARALAAAHRAGVVHRDVKPTNIFLVDNGDALPHVKLLDFGIAKVRGTGEATITPADSVIGTPSYMSPEQLENSSEVNASADLWSLAVVAYHCLTGMLPFRGDTFGARCYAIAQGRYERATVVAPHLPRSIDAWFLRAFAIDRGSRFSSARELAETLATVLDVALEPSDEVRDPGHPRLHDERSTPAARDDAFLEHTAMEAVRSSVARSLPRSRRGPALGAAIVVALGVTAVLVASLARRLHKEEVVREPGPSGTAHFLPAGKTVRVTVRSGDEQQTLDVLHSGRFAFPGRLRTGATYEATTNDPDCWIRRDREQGRPVELDLRCRSIEERRSRSGPSSPARSLEVSSTTSAKYEDVPLLDPIELDTDIAADVLVTLSVPANGFLRTATIAPGGTGVLALDVDGEIVEEAEHRPLSEGQAAPNAIVALVTLPAGHHVLKARRRVDDLTTPSRFLLGDTIDGVDMEKVFDATVLESLETFRGLSISSIGPQAEPALPGRMRSLQTTIRSEGIVMGGLHVPAFSALDAHSHSDGRVQLFANDDHVDAALGASEKLERSASLLWISPYAIATSVTVSAGSGGKAPILMPRGAHLFAATFDRSVSGPAPAPQVVAGLVRAAHSTRKTVAQLRWSTAARVRLLVTATLARVYSNHDGGSGFVTLRHDGQIVSRAFFQSQSSGAGQGAALVAVIDVPPGPCTLELELESRLGDVFIGDDERSRSVLTALPLQ